MAILEKKVILFTDDETLVTVVTSNLLNNTAGVYSYNAYLSDISFVGKIVLLDLDTVKVNIKSFTEELLKHLKPENQLIVIGTDCDRKNIVEFTKLGIDRFIVKPLNKKRFKTLILPYIESEDVSSDVLM